MRSRSRQRAARPATEVGPRPCRPGALARGSTLRGKGCDSAAHGGPDASRPASAYPIVHRSCQALVYALASAPMARWPTPRPTSTQRASWAGTDPRLTDQLGPALHVALDQGLGLGRRQAEQRRPARTGQTSFPYRGRPHPSPRCLARRDAWAGVPWRKPPRRARSRPRLVRVRWRRYRKTDRRARPAHPGRRPAHHDRSRASA